MPHPTHPLHPLTLSDIDAVLSCAQPAFLHDALSQATFPPHLVDPSNPDEQLSFRRERIRKRLGEGTGYVCFKVLDPADPAKIAAWASWVRPQHGTGEKVLRDAAPAPEDRPRCAAPEILDAQLRYMKESKAMLFGEDGNFWCESSRSVLFFFLSVVARCKKMSFLFGIKRSRWSDFPHFLIDLSGLATHPDFQGKGMGAALVRWGMEQAEKDGVPVHLVATPAGRVLYTKLGFEVVVEFDMSRFIPNGGQYVFTSMIWRPSGKVQ